MLEVCFVCGVKGMQERVAKRRAEIADERRKAAAGIREEFTVVTAGEFKKPGQ